MTPPTLDSSYDIAVVGGRIAGSAAAIGLARAGYRVLLLERQAMPSDTLSTHVLWPDGLHALRRLGLLAPVLTTGAPPARHFRLCRGEDSLVTPLVPLDDIDYLLCVRRIMLDGVIWEAASRTPGVDAFDRTSVTGLVHGDGRVTGIEVAGAGRIETRLVVGADGRNSLVAREVGAEEDDIVPPGRYWYYGYFRDARLPDPAAPELTESDTETETIAAMPTNDGLQMVIYGAFDEDFDEFRRDHRANYLQRITAHPCIARMLDGATLESPVYGISGVRGYYRTAWGPGWVLVGDAAHQKDPIVARGVNEALLSAEWLSEALASGITDATLDVYAARLRAGTRTRALTARMLARPDRHMTADQGARLMQATATPAGLAQFLRLEYDDSLGFDDFFGDCDW